MPTVTPLALAKRTPLTNCGQCGQPTCLAFAVAVLKTGLSAELCPYLDPTGLDLGSITTVPRDQKERDLALIASLKEKIAPLDLAAIAPQLGATIIPGEPDALSFRYLGQAVTLSRTTLLLDGHSPEDPRDQILLYNYVFGRGTRKPTGDWVGMESLPNSISKVKTLATYGEDRLARLLAEQPAEKVWSALRAVGGGAAKTVSATLAAVVPVLPLVPHYLLFWEGAPEDHFPARVKLLFDRQVLSFLDLESLVFSAERLADRLTLLVNP